MSSLAECAAAFRALTGHVTPQYAQDQINHFSDHYPLVYVSDFKTATHHDLLAAQSFFAWCASYVSSDVVAVFLTQPDIVRESMAFFNVACLAELRRRGLGSVVSLVHRV